MKNILLYIMLGIFLLSCSSLPKNERTSPIHDVKDQALVYLERGHRESLWNNNGSALHMYKESFRLAASVDWQDGMIRALVQMSRSEDLQGNSEQSALYIEQCKILMEHSDNPELKLLLDNRECEWLYFNGNIQAALDRNDRTRNQLENIKSREMGESYRIAAVIYKSLKNYSIALEMINTAIEFDEKNDFISELTNDYYIKASILSLQGLMTEAVESLEYALTKDKYLENSAGIAQDLYALGLIYEKNDFSDKAYYYFSRSYLVYKSFNENRIPENLKNRLINADKDIIWE